MHKALDEMSAMSTSLFAAGQGVPLARCRLSLLLDELSTLNIPLEPPCRLQDDRECWTCVTGLARALSTARVPRHISIAVLEVDLDD